jgi:hypothetical protein
MRKIDVGVSDETRARGWEELRLAFREGPDLQQAYARMLDVLVPLVAAETLEEASDGLCCGQELDHRATLIRAQVPDA